MTIDILVHPKFAKRVLQRRLVDVVYKTLKQRVSDSSITIYITTDSEIRALNRKFHATDAPTDVLSFPTGVKDYLGDVVISYDRARVQAHAARWHIADELDLLAVHGVLHLLDYDDLTPRQRAKMWKRQEEILGHPIPEKETE
jgi:probable rRNA maturation factor